MIELDHDVYIAVLCLLMEIVEDDVDMEDEGNNNPNVLMQNKFKVDFDYEEVFLLVFEL